MIAQFAIQKWGREFVYTMVLDALEFAPEGGRGQFYLSPTYGTKHEPEVEVTGK